MKLRHYGLFAALLFGISASPAGAAGFDPGSDGSATIWIGETEKTMDMRGVIGMTLRPGRSYIEVDYRINNTIFIIESILS